MTHLLQSLQSAAKLAVAHGNTVGDISIEHWSITFRQSSETVKTAFELAQSQASLKPCSSEEFDGK